nr:DapH/DapD/GlmU-related protein [Nanchangia anserum]
MARGVALTPDSEATAFMHARAERSREVTQYINTRELDQPSIRAELSQLLGEPIDESVTILPRITIDGGVNLHFGRSIFVNAGCSFQDQGGVWIGDGTFIGHNAVFATLNHDEDPDHRATLHPAPIVVEANVWIGSQASILAGVRIGEGAIVGAGSVVTRDVAPRSIVAGVPARYIRDVRSREATSVREG